MSKRAELITAIAFYTDGEMNPTMYTSAYDKLITRLEKADACPYQFCFFISYFKKNITAKGPIRLTFTNLLNAYKTFREFTRFSKGRTDTVKRVVFLQREAFKANLAAFGDDEEFVIRSSSFDLSAPVRIELALELGYPEIVDGYIETAAYMLKGSPEYLEHCPLLKAHLSTRRNT